MAYQVEMIPVRFNKDLLEPLRWSRSLLGHDDLTWDDFMGRPRLCSLQPRRLGLNQLFKRPAASKEEASPSKRLVTEKKDGFEVSVNVDGFAPRDMEVKVVNGFVVVTGKHEELSEDGNYCSSRQFSRRYKLPANVNLEAIKSALAADGKVLRIEAPLVAIEAPKEKTIPIEVTKEQAVAPASVVNEFNDETAMENDAPTIEDVGAE